MGKRRAGYGITNIFRPKKASTDRALFRGKHLVAPGTASFSPGRSWSKGTRSGAHFGGVGKMTSGKKLYESGGLLAKGARSDSGIGLGDMARTYKGEGDGKILQEQGRENPEADMFRDNPGGAVSSLNIGQGSQGFIKSGWERGVRRPFEDWWKGELKESQDYYAVRERDVSQDLLDTLSGGGIDATSLQGLMLPKEFSTEEWNTISGEAQANMDEQLEALRNVWIADDNYAADDPRAGARQALVERMEEAGLTESDIFQGGEATTGSGYQDIEGKYDAALESKDISSRQAARERIKANLQGGAGVRGAQAAAGASGLAYSGAQQGRIEEATQASQDDLTRIRESEKASLGALQDARTERERSYEEITKNVTGESGAFGLYEGAKEEKLQSADTYLTDALQALEDYGAELDSMLSFTPSQVIGRGDIKKQRRLDKQRSRFFGGTQQYNLADYRDRKTGFDTSREAISKVSRQIGED
tara:strand:- start:1122 stop:2549 length:1428 start_codon:yes stop_codon:yes gene_type:complete